MATLYLTEQGSRLVKTGERLVVEKEGVKLLDVPLIKIDTILIYGNVQLSTQAISLLLTHGVETAFLSMQGRLKGQLTPIKHKNVFLRLAQYRRAQEKPFTVNVAKAIVHQKIENFIGFIRRFQYNHPEMDFSETIERLKRLQESLPRKTEAHTVLGIEGMSAVEYYKALSRMFIGELKFEGRNRRPPRDPVNALLSFGYVLITNELTSLLDAHGFDPYIGFLHGLDYGRPSLALDLVEEFRVPIIDRLILQLANRKVFKNDDFEPRDGGVYLKPEPLKRFFYHYEKWLNEKRGAEQVSFRDAFKQQTQKMAKAITQGTSYDPVDGLKLCSS